MNITQEPIDALNAIITIQLKKDDYIEKVEKLLKEKSKKEKFPGFRPGMVPAGHIRKLYGKTILVEEVNKLLSASLNNYLQQNKINILGQPLPADDHAPQPNWDFEEDFEFKYELGLAPQFDFSINKEDRLSAYDVIPDEETLNARIKNLRRAYGKMSTPEFSEPGDVLYGEFQQLAQDGTPFTEGIVNSASLRLEMVKDEEILTGLIGLKIGDVVDIDLQKALDKNAHQIGHLLKIDEESAKQLGGLFRLSVKNVNRLEESDLDEEFFLKIYPDGTVKTEEEFRAGVAKELRSMTEQQATKRLDNDIVNLLISKFSAQLPDTFLKKWLKVANEERFTPEQIDEQYSDFQKNLKWTLIENRIMQEQAIEVKTEEVIAHAKKKLAEQYRMYSPEPLPEEQLTDYAIKLIQDREQASKVYEEIRSQKVLDYIKSVIEIGSKEIFYNEFIKID